MYLTRHFQKNPAHLIVLILNCSQLITEPTRRTLNTSTALDLIFTSTPQLRRSSGVIECPISDHDFIFTVIKHRIVNNSSPKCITTRDLKHFDIQLYNEDLIEADLDSLVENQADLDIAWHIWSEKVTNIMNKHALLKTYRVKARNNPWMNLYILILMYTPDYLCKKAKETGNKALYTQYKQARNKVVNDIRKANLIITLAKSINLNPLKRCGK